LKLALISLAKDAPDGAEPIGFMPLFDGMIVDQQVQAVLSAGVEKIVLISPTMKSAVLQYADKLQGQGISIEIVRGGHDLIQFAAPENDILYLADGILPDSELIQRLAIHEDEAIFTAKDGEQLADFERIDQNDRWLGIALLQASRLSDFIDLPEDWDVGSALLRGAVQSGCSREYIEDSAVSSGSLSSLHNEPAIGVYSNRKLKQASNSLGNFLERLVIRPLTLSILPRLWKMPDAKAYFGWASLAMGLLGGVFVALEMPVVIAVFCLFPAAASLYIRGNIQLFSRVKSGLDIVCILSYLTMAAVMLAMVVRSSIPVSLTPNIVIFILGISLIWLIGRSNLTSKWNWVKPDTSLSLLILGGFSVFGLFVYGIYAVALLGIFFLLASQLGQPHGR